MNCPRKAISPIDQDPSFDELIKAFPIGTKFNQEQALHQLGFENTATNSTYISQLMRDISTKLSHCPEGVQLKPSYGCRFYVRKS